MFECTDCKKEFTTKANLNYHIKHKSCKNGDKVQCKYCEKTFTSAISMYRHIRNSCKEKKEEDNNKHKIYEKLLELQREVETLSELKNEVKILKEKSIQLEKDNIKLKKQVKQRNNTINNGIMANKIDTINNIMLVGYGQEDISKIDKKDILKGIKSGFYSTVKLTDTIHFNPKYPAYHNVYISSMKNKYAMMYDGNDWTLVMKDELIDKLYDEKKNYIEENLEDFYDALSRSQKKALERWMDIDDDHEKIKEVKDKIKLLLYNKKYIVLDNKNTKIKDSQKVKNK